MILYKPQQAWRVRWSTYTDTPVPQEEPAGENPPDGAVINYHLTANASQVKLEILDNKGKLVRTYTSNDKPYTKPKDNVPDYWVRPQQILSAKAGAHRFSWDLHYDPLGIEPTFPISAVYKNTPPDPTSPWVMPGTYTARLTVDGKVHEESFQVKMDPRIKTATKDLQAQHDISLSLYELRKQLLAIRPVTEDGKRSMERQINRIGQVFDMLQGSDTKPTTAMISAAAELLH
jgi:hypothetical protein